MNKIIAVDTHTEGAGAITYWSLHGQVDHGPLMDAWDAYAMPPEFAPVAMKVGAAMKCSLDSLANGRMIRSLNSRTAWALVDEVIEGRAEEASLAYKPVLKVWIENDEANFADNESGEDDLPTAIRAAFKSYLGKMRPQDVSGWLVDLALKYADAVSLRKMGGIYYIPPDTLPLWEEALEVLREACPSHATVFLIPAMNTDEAVQAILAAVVTDATDVLDGIEQDLHEHPDYSKRALVNRETRCIAALKKLDSYNSLLGDRLDDIKGRLQSMKATVTRLTMKREVKDD